MCRCPNGELRLDIAKYNFVLAAMAKDKQAVFFFKALKTCEALQPSHTAKSVIAIQPVFFYPSFLTKQRFALLQHHHVLLLGLL